MKPQVLPVSVVAAGLLLAAAQPAFALSGQCFWSHLEPPTRSDLLEGYQRQGPQVLDRVDDWKWTDGLKPADNAPEWGMDKFRDRFMTAFAK